MSECDKATALSPHQATWSPISDQNGFVKYCYQYRIQRGGKCGAYRRISRNDEILDRKTDNLTSCCYSRSYTSLVRGFDDTRCAPRAFSIRSLNTLKSILVAGRSRPRRLCSFFLQQASGAFTIVWKHHCWNNNSRYECNVAVFSPVYPSFLAGCEYNFIDNTQKES